MGQAELAKQTEPALAQHERVLGCDLVATKKIGGRNVSRLALWHSNVAECPWLHVDGHPYAQLRHWREHSDFQRRECDSVEAIAIPEPGATCDGMGDKPWWVWLARKNWFLGA